MLLNKPPCQHSYKSTIKFEYHFIIKIRRKLLQLYRNDFFLCVKKAFPNFKSIFKRTWFIKIICFLKCCWDSNKYNNLKREKSENMHFSRVKCVDKIQYDNYHGDLSCYFDFKFFISLFRLLTNSSNVWRSKTYNGVKMGGKTCFRKDIDFFIRMHKLV